MNERELNNLATQYAYCRLGSSPCKYCDDFCECFYECNDKCKEAQEYNERYEELVEEKVLATV